MLYAINSIFGNNVRLCVRDFSYMYLIKTEIVKMFTLLATLGILFIKDLGATEVFLMGMLLDTALLMTYLVKRY